MSDTAAHLGERPLDDDSLDASTAHYARARLDEEVVLASLFVFRLGDEWLGLPTALLVTVAPPPVVHSLPRQRRTVLAGLVNVGGDLVVHASLPGLLGIPSGDPATETVGRRRSGARLVVLADPRGPLAITVDEVWGVHHLDPSALRPVPSTLSRAPTSFATSMCEVDGRMVGCLDAARVMDALSRAIG